MKLLVLFDHVFRARPDGTVFSVQNYNRDLFERRYLSEFSHVTVAARLRRASAEEMVRADGVGLDTDRLSFEALPDWKRSRELLRSVGRLIKSHDAILMIVPGLVGTVALPLLLKTGRPFGVEVVGDPWDSLRWLSWPASFAAPILRLGMRAGLQAQCRHAVAATYVTRDYLQRRYAPGPQTYAVACSDVRLRDDAYVEQPRAVAQFRRHGPRIILCVGTFEREYKGQDLAIEALSRLLARAPALQARMVFVGDGRLRSKVEQQACSLGLGRIVEFCGQLASGAAVRSQMARADLLLAPSRTEGLPRVVIEAMAMGLPVVATAVGGVPELLASEDLVRVDDPNQIADALERTLTDPDRLARMSARNLRAARAYHDAVLDEQRLVFYRVLRERTEASLIASGFQKE